MKAIDTDLWRPADDIFWFDADGIVHIRNSERGTMDKCPTRWWWAWREGLRPKETAKALWFGTGWHLAMSIYYGPGKKRRPDEALQAWHDYADENAEYVRTKGATLNEDQFVEARTLGTTMLQGYFRHWSGDRKWDVIATEHPFAVKIPLLSATKKMRVWQDPFFRKWIKANIPDYFILNGTFDGVYRDGLDRKRPKLMEHKTAGSISTGHLTMDNQGGTYWMVAETVGKAAGWLDDGTIAEITYNYARKALPDARPTDAKGYATNKPLKAHYIAALEAAEVDIPPKATAATLMELAGQHDLVVIGERSKVQPAPLFMRHPVKKTPRHRATQLVRLQKEVLHMYMVVGGVLPITKSPSRDHCGFCDFKELCELHETGSDWERFRRAMYRADDQYVEHKSASPS